MAGLTRPSSIRILQSRAGWPSALHGYSNLSCQHGLWDHVTGVHRRDCGVWTASYSTGSVYSQEFGTVVDSGQVRLSAVATGSVEFVVGESVFT